jgi:hypothetical protein
MQRTPLRPPVTNQVNVRFQTLIPVAERLRLKIITDFGLSVWDCPAPTEKPQVQPRFLGNLLRFVFAKSSSCFSDIDFSICFEAPLRLDFDRFPRFAANAAPAAICCFFEVAGIPVFRRPVQIRPDEKLKMLDCRELQRLAFLDRVCSAARTE